MEVKPECYVCSYWHSYWSYFLPCCCLSYNRYNSDLITTFITIVLLVILYFKRQNVQINVNDKYISSIILYKDLHRYIGKLMAYLLTKIGQLQLITW